MSIKKNGIAFQKNVFMNHFYNWVLYYDTIDYPNVYVARRFNLDVPTQECFSDYDIDKVRQWIVKESVLYNNCLPERIEREENDDPVIREVWI
jgi:hypothetical protein